MHQRKSAESAGEKNKNCFPQIAQINAEKESAEICGICGRKKQELFPVDDAD